MIRLRFSRLRRDREGKNRGRAKLIPTVGIHEYNGIEITSYDSNTLLPTSKTIGYLGQPNKYMYYTYDSLGRKTGYKLSASSSSAAEGLSAVNYTYDDYGRFHSVSSSVNSVSSVVNYSYLENSSLIAGYTSPNGFGVSKYYENYRNLIVGVSNYFGVNCISSFEYQNDALGRRSQRVDNNIDYSVAITNTFAYNGYSEVTNAIMNTDNYNYIFDEIGNREEFQINTTSVDYENSQLNQCLEANSSNPAYDKSFAFDFDGNMITNNIWAYTWNGENRMTSATNYVDNTYITYAYDYQGRMVSKKLYSLGVLSGSTLFYWNGNHIIAEYCTDTASCVSNYYTWANGETLTASLNGETVFYCHDANKNITDLVDTDGDLVAHYEYSPFGVITDQSGILASENIFRFSNEVFDSTTGLIEYKYRKYIPDLGKFLSRDPIGVQGGLNLYGIGGNDLINNFDYLGQEPCYKQGEPRWISVEKSTVQPINCTGKSKLVPAAVNNLISQQAFVGLRLAFDPGILKCDYTWPVELSCKCEFKVKKSTKQRLQTCSQTGIADDFSAQLEWLDNPGNITKFKFEPMSKTQYIALKTYGIILKAKKHEDLYGLFLDWILSKSDECAALCRNSVIEGL